MCRDDEGYYINVSQEHREVVTVARDIKNLNDTKIEFLNVVWEIS
ncbi:hypothetical protein [Terrisporobacter sp.]|nr:hypothetical protein [Terrisporobacter sp.]